MKIKMKDRYSMGWSDARGIFGNNNDVNPLKTGMNLGRKTNLEDVPTDVLRNLWLAKFGGRAVTMNDMHNHRFDDIADVGQELANRNLIRLETLERPDIMERNNYYILEKEDGNN
jgi:hypothetical protein